jgi:hypothetical protein
MICISIEDALGNQMFSYASAKSIAIDLEVEFKYSVTRPKYVLKNQDFDEYGHRWYSDFDEYFNIDKSQRVEDFKNISVWKEPWPRGTNYFKELYSISEDTELSGHFCSELYFAHRRREVLSWFTFSQDVRTKVEKEYSYILNEKTIKLIAIHIRYGADYIEQGKAVSIDYYKEALEKIINKYKGHKVQVVLFTDAREEVELHFSKFNPIVSTGTPFEDLYLMTLCDAFVIGNSTFGWWGAWISQKLDKIVLRPSIFPLGGNEFYPIDIFPEEWDVVNAIRMKPNSNKLKILSNYFKRMARRFFY